MSLRCAPFGLMFQYNTTMPLISAFLTRSVYILSVLEAFRCYTYQTQPLFLSFTELAELEQNPSYRTNKPTSYLRDDKPFAVKCHEDSIEVVIRAHLFDPRLPVEPTHFRLGSISAGHRHCMPGVSGDGEYVIRAPLTECGTAVMLTRAAVLYNNLLLFSPPTSPGDMMQAGGVAVPVQCKYGRRYAVSSGALRPTWSPPTSIQSTLLNLDFRLRLMTSDWSSERKSSVYVLGETVDIEASVDHHHLPLRLYADSCVATLTPDVSSYPRYPFIDHQGCFTDSQLHGSSSRFLPRLRDQLLQIQLQPFLFHEDQRTTIYITCYLEAEPISNKEPVKRACSFMSGRWRSVDGDGRVCEGCSTKFNHRRAPRSRHAELRRETSLGPVTFLL